MAFRGGLAADRARLVGGLGHARNMGRGAGRASVHQSRLILIPLVPAKGGTQLFSSHWIPACAGMSGIRHLTPRR
jgi:hypothetical protein